MFDLDNWQEIWATITRNKFRSILTGLGVSWGLFMLIILVGVGNSFEGGILKNVDGFAANSCFFFTDRTSEAYKGYRKGRWWNMNNRDLTLIKQKAQSVELISPVLFGDSGDKNVVRGPKSGSYGTRGVYPAHFQIEQQHILAGRLFNDLDIEGYRKVCVIGKEVYETLFKPDENPQGQYIRVNGIYFQVIGVIRPKSGASIGGDVESTVFIPFSTMQRAFNQGDKIHFLACTTKSGYTGTMVEEEVKNILRVAHDIAPTDDKAVRSFNIEKEFQMFNNLFTGINFLIWFVGGGALLSGIIGISNIMLVTVRERTREIGVRRALGAKPVTIVKQILSESFVLTALAGFIGFFAGVALVELVSYFMTGNIGDDVFLIPPFVSFWTAIKAMCVLIIAGVLSGLMPAMRALSIKAIDAIREE
ncbi:ABC transporter permease [Dysgonomonas sp. BGC7]|uniref:ABC transporter permease n=1 Tax=Dysgonomonas sp. BGC7 TaxID=1658008 RepID=UPI000681C2B4|nr:ABC transporter permease [Dysgonomonas sp. BGC7]MBD8389289.1 ABC transporter permease [Dysgonomonas sp. BGC7]